jgi:phosphate-selective porin OprO/OprP
MMTLTPVKASAKVTGLALAALLSTTAMSSSALAQGGADIEALQAQIDALQAQVDAIKQNQEATPEVKKAEPAPEMRTRDKMFEWNLRGRIFADKAWVNDSDNSANIDSTEFRAARLGIEGKAWKTIKYKFEADFIDNEVDVKDAYLEWQGPITLTMGQFKTPNSLDEETSARHTTFMERATFTDAFGFSREIGVAVSVGNDTTLFKAGVFQGGNGTANDDEGYTIAARLHHSFELEDGFAHVGASFRHRDVGDDQSDLRYRVRTPIHLSDRFINTDRIADSDTFYGIEAAAIYGPFHVAGEYGIQEANLSAPAAGQSDPSFDGYYLEAGWFVTGEQKGYKGSSGTMDRPKVNSPVHEGGLGAWQIAARYDVTDLSDEGIFGGEQENITFGVNWYLNRHTRIMANYTTSDVKDAFLVAANGADGENDIDSFGLRFQVDW